MSSGSDVMFTPVGNDTHRDWISVGKPGTFDGKSFYPGASYVEVTGALPNWGDRFVLYDNEAFGGGMTW